MTNERITGIYTGVIQEYKPATSLGGDTNDPVAIVEYYGESGEKGTAWIPDEQNFEPGTLILMTRIETRRGLGSRTDTLLTQLERD